MTVNRITQERPWRKKTQILESNRMPALGGNVIYIDFESEWFRARFWLAHPNHNIIGKQARRVFDLAHK